jgi:hypothetical protein
MFDDPLTHIFLELILTAGAQPLYMEVRNGEIIAYYNSCHSAAKLTGVDPTNIRNVLKGRRPATNGFIFKYDNTVARVQMSS